MKYRRPTSVTAVAELLDDDPEALVVAGGTDVYPATVGRTLEQNVIDLSAVDELRGIELRDEQWVFGACTTWTEIARSNLPEQFTALQQAAPQIGGLQVQNRGTLGGNLCTASPAGDSIPVLMALSARVELTGPNGTRNLALHDFITGYRATALDPGEFVSAIRVPARHGMSNFQKLGSRTHLVISIVMVAAHVEPGPEPVARVAVGACSPVAVRLRGLEEQLRSDLSPDVAERYGYPELQPIDDVRASASYRVDVVAPLVARSIAACLPGGAE